MTATLKRPRVVLVALSIVLVAAFAAPALAAQNASSLSGFFASTFPDNGDVRAKLFSTIIGAPREQALAYGTKTHQAKKGPVTVRAVKRANDFIIEFVNGSLDSPAMGSCYIQRSNAKGYMMQAKILLQDDPSCYLRLYPQGSGTRGDVVMYGALVKKGIYFEGMLYRIIILPFSDIVDMTKRSFDWSLVYRLDGAGESDALIADLRQSAPPAAAQPGQASPAPRPALASLPAVQAGSAKGATRAARLYDIASRAATVEALALELGQAGEVGAREISLASEAALGFGDDRGDPGFSAYGAFPRYEAGKGIALSALRAALFLDLRENPGSAYVLAAEGLRAVAAPSSDGQGRLSFAFFVEGKEASWEELSSRGRDLKVRAVRIPASRD